MIPSHASLPLPQIEKLVERLNRPAMEEMAEAMRSRISYGEWMISGAPPRKEDFK